MSEVITLRVSPAIAEAVLLASGKRTVADWLREVISRAAGLNAEPTVGHFMPARHRLIARHEDVAVLAELARDTARAVGMLKVAAQVLRETDNKDLHRQAEQTLIEMQKAAREIQARLSGQSK